MNGCHVGDDVVFIAPVSSLMKGAGTTGELADEALYGMAAPIVDKENGMLKVNMRYRYEGFVEPQCVIYDVDVKEWEQRASYRVIAPFADIQEEPSFQSNAITTLPRGALLEIGDPFYDEKGKSEWLSAILADGQNGFVRSHSVRLARKWQELDPERMRKNVIADAMLYMGAQYRWGGKSHYGIDCSGLTAMAYMLNGLFIYRDARIVEGYPVKEISAEAAQPADMLFWPGHIGLYLGDGLYIHATGKSSGVVINSLKPEHPEYREDLAIVEKWGSVF